MAIVSSKVDEVDKVDDELLQIVEKVFEDSLTDLATAICKAKMAAKGISRPLIPDDIGAMKEMILNSWRNLTDEQLKEIKSTWKQVSEAGLIFPLKDNKGN